MAKNIGGTVLDILGSLGTVAGPLIFGPDFKGDLGAPFAMGAAYLKQNKLANTLGDILSSNPHTAPLVDMAGQIQQSGGLLNLLNSDQSLGSSSMYDNLQKPSNAPMLEQSTPQLQTDPSLGMVQMPAAAPQIPTTPQVPSAAINPSGGQGGFKNVLDLMSQPENLKKLADIDPEMAMKFITSGARAEADPMQMIAAQLGIQSKLANIPGTLQYNQERADKIADREALQKSFSDTIGGRQKEMLAEQKKLWNSKETEDISALEQVQGQFKALPNEIPGNSTMYKALASIPLIGRAAASRQYPELAQFDKLVADAEAQLAFARGGKNLTGVEAKLTLDTLPDFVENPAIFGLVKQSAESRLQLAKLAKLKGMEKSGRDVSDYPIQEYKDWQEALNSGIPLEQLQKSPAFQKATQELGLQGLFVKFPEKKK